MKVSIDKETCTGCGLCESSCADVFKVNDSNIAEVVSEKFDSCDIKQVAAECPVEAIKVEE